MSNKWTKPIGECSTGAAAASTPQQQKQPARIQANIQPLKPQAPAEEKPAAPSAPSCEFKPVMSDEDLAACGRAPS
jgi:hypothetical protein